jgi:hypothetical protein
LGFTVWWVTVVVTLGLQFAFADSVQDTPSNRKAAAERYLEAVSIASMMDDVVAAMVPRLPEN